METEETEATMAEYLLHVLSTLFWPAFMTSMIVIPIGLSLGGYALIESVGNWYSHLIFVLQNTL